MYYLILVALIFLITCDSTSTLFIVDPKDAGREKNTDEGYFYVIRSHALKKRDVYSIESGPGVKPKDDTIIIMPNSGTSVPYSNYYPTYPIPSYGPNSGTTVVVSNPDGNYYNGYGSKYVPKYG